MQRLLGELLGRRAARSLAFAVLAMYLTTVPAAAAMDIVVTVSPSVGVVGRPIEVLVTTFVPINNGDLALPSPPFPNPGPSGLWNVLYPVSAYPFDVEATSPTNDVVTIVLTRDPSDASLWRGTFVPTAPGLWSVAIRNFPHLQPTTVLVSATPAETPNVLLLGATALVAVAIGLVVGRSARYRSDRRRT